MDDRHRDIYGYIFTNMPAVVALVDRGRPRFHKHEIGRHCDSRRDSTRWNSLLRRGRSSALTKLAAFDRWRCRSSSTLWRFSSRYANPLLSKFYSTLTISILLGTRWILFGGDVLKFLRHPRRSGRTCVNLKKRPPSFSKVAPLLYPACTCASMISLQSSDKQRDYTCETGLQIETLCHDEKDLTKNLSLTSRFYTFRIYLLSFWRNYVLILEMKFSSVLQNWRRPPRRSQFDYVPDIQRG